VRENMFPVVRLIEETKGGGKEEETDTKNTIQKHHICIGTRPQETLKTVELCTVVGKR
jgi:hypothetical protein